MDDPASPTCAAPQFLQGGAAENAYMGFLTPAELQARLGELWALAPEGPSRAALSKLLDETARLQPAPDQAAFQTLLAATLPIVRDDATLAALKPLLAG